VLRQRVPRVEREIARERELLGGVETLDREPQLGDCDVRREALRPAHRRVLDRHPVRIGLDLDEEVEHDLARVRALERGRSEYCIAWPAPRRYGTQL
jgi:hypothetical protein